MLSNKPERAKIIIDCILSRDAECGCIAPGRNPQKNARQISWGSNWRVVINPDQRAVLGPIYGERFGDRFVADKGCRVLELLIGQKRMLVANLRGTDIDIYRFVPGAWERMFGSDPGIDHMPYGPEVFPRPGTVEEELFLRNVDRELAPLRNDPTTSEDLRSEFFVGAKPKRSKSTGTGQRHRMWPDAHAPR